MVHTHFGIAGPFENLMKFLDSLSLSLSPEGGGGRNHVIMSTPLCL